MIALIAIDCFDCFDCFVSDSIALIGLTPPSIGRCEDNLYQAQQDIIILTPDTQGDYFERPYRAPYTYGNCPYGTVKRVKGQAANENLKGECLHLDTQYFCPIEIT